MRRVGRRLAPRRSRTKAGTIILWSAHRASTRQASFGNSVFQVKFSYVYILQSETDTKHYYVGLTDDLKDRLRRHNVGEVPHTSKYRPWKIKTAIAFTDRSRAVDFERYLKTASGRAFAKKRL
jgi:predicted GIY-YIG superfamily endonuclease